MRTVALLIAALIPVLAAAEERADGEKPQLKAEIEIEAGHEFAGYVPAKVVRPTGDTVVADLPHAASSAEIRFSLGLGVVGVEAQPFMLNSPVKNGPSVVGLHYLLFVRPFDCDGVDGDLGLDLPWRNPCLDVGFAHRSAHNMDDGTYNGTYADSAAVRLRIFRGKRSQGWLRGEYALASLESPFVLTEETHAVASDLETRLWLVGAVVTLARGDGTATLESELRGSRSGPAAAGGRLRYAHRLEITGPVSLSLIVGATAGIEANLRKREALGGNAAQLQAFVGLPLFQ